MLANLHRWRGPAYDEWLDIAQSEDDGELFAVMLGCDENENFGYYADPVDHSTATLPKGWKGRLVNLPPSDTEGVRERIVTYIANDFKPDLA